MLAADRALPARDHPRRRFKLTGIELLVILDCTQGRQGRLEKLDERRQLRAHERVRARKIDIAQIADVFCEFSQDC